MRKTIGLIALTVSFAFAGKALALDGAGIYKAKCAICHGEKGEGKKGMGPAHKGNDFITKGNIDEIKKVILDGRTGDAKKYKEFPAPMPKSGLSNADTEAVVKFMQADLQK